MPHLSEIVLDGAAGAGESKIPVYCKYSRDVSSLPQLYMRAASPAADMPMPQREAEKVFSTGYMSQSQRSVTG